MYITKTIIMRSKKYYIIYRNRPSLMDEFLCRHDFSDDLRVKIYKRSDSNKPLLLLEKTENKNNTESYTNLWTVDEGCEINWIEHTKNRFMFDYTGIVLVIHCKGKHYSWDEYNTRLNKSEKDKM